MESDDDGRGKAEILGSTPGVGPTMLLLDLLDGFFAIAGVGDGPYCISREKLTRQRPIDPGVVHDQKMRHFGQPR